jgi:hypothetical protein
MLWQLLLPGGLVRGLSRPAGEIREGWLEGPGGLSPGRRVSSSNVGATGRMESQDVVQVVP